MKPNHKLIIPALLLCCTPQLSADDYKIKKGGHYSTPHTFKEFKGSRMEFQAMFDETAKYEFQGNAASDQADTNKLFGFSDCGSMDPTKNSARIGWRWYNGQLEAMAFTHANGTMQQPVSLGPMDIKKLQNFTIELSSDRTKYIYTYGSNKVEMDRGCTDDVAKGELLKPYFGGNQEAPHDINIKVDYSDKYAEFSASLIYPNPARKDDVNVDLCVKEPMNIGFKVYDLQGKLIKVTQAMPYEGGQDYKKQKVEMPEDIATGMYLIVPYGEKDGEEKPGVVESKGNALKVIIIK